MYSVYDGFFYSCMLGFAETYFSAYALFLGANNFQIGLLSALPPFIAGIAQFQTIKLMNWVPSRRQLVCTGVLFQALALIPVALCSQIQTLKIEWYIIFVCIYFTSNAIINPVWNSWMGDLVSPFQRGVYFGRRNRVVTIGTFVTMIAAGLILRYFRVHSQLIYGFYIIFGLAILSRFISLSYLSRKFEPPITSAIKPREPFLKFLKKLTTHNNGRLIAYMGTVNFAVFLSAAYFTPYMLSNLNFTYTLYTGVISGAALAKFVSSSFWGELCDKLGTKKVLYACGLCVCLTTLPWLFTTHPALLFLAQCFTGFVWAGYELATFTFLLDTTQSDERPQMTSNLNIIVATTGLLGGLTGAVLVETIKFQGNPFVLVFALSAAIRVFAFIAFGRKLQEVKVHTSVRARDVLIQATGFKSAMGFTSKLVFFAKKKSRTKAQRPLPDSHDQKIGA